MPSHHTDQFTSFRPSGAHTQATLQNLPTDGSRTARALRALAATRAASLWAQDRKIHTLSVDLGLQTRPSFDGWLAVATVARPREARVVVVEGVFQVVSQAAIPFGEGPWPLRLGVSLDATEALPDLLHARARTFLAELIARTEGLAATLARGPQPPTLGEFRAALDTWGQILLSALGDGQRLVRVDSDVESSLGFNGKRWALAHADQKCAVTALSGDGGALYFTATMPTRLQEIPFPPVTEMGRLWWDTRVEEQPAVLAPLAFRWQAPPDRSALDAAFDELLQRVRGLRNDWQSILQDLDATPAP